MQNKHQIIGTTIYIGKSQLKTIYGQMTAYTFQDLIHKGYIIALAHGDLNAQILYTRMHSSCVTSELMRSLDCDCKQQLNGAIRKICSGNGILFYLIQEGRGCGYVGKSRACMNVQYYEQKQDINTFEAYQMLGMRHDYRQYTVVKDIITILNIGGSFILLTNNPDKIQKFQKLGIKLKTVQSIQIQPNAFNQTYLVSKEQYGHILFQTKTKVQKFEIPYSRIQPFTPYSLPNAERFVHVSSYYLPLKPVWNRVVISPEQYEQTFKLTGISKSYQIVSDPARNNKYSYYTQLTSEQIQQNSEQFSKPNWFQINVHYDIVTHNDYLVLKYGDCKQKGRVPIVRIHSQSLFNRFPLTDHEYGDRYKLSIDQIIRNGCGLILIFYNDGRGSGFGYYVLNTINDSVQGKRKIGVEEDKRDYFGAIKLLKNYLNLQNPIDVLTGQSSFQKLLEQFSKNGLNVRNSIRLSNESEKQGIYSIEQRIRSIKVSVQVMAHQLDLISLRKASKKLVECIQQGKTIYSTGIGSSQAHSKSMEAIFLGKIRHITPLDLKSLNSEDDTLILFSQNLSPNIICCLDDLNFKNLIVITSVNPQEPSLLLKKSDFIKKLQQSGAIFLRYPRQIPDDTLLRISGPFIGFCLILMLKKITQKPIETQNIEKTVENFLKQLNLLYENINRISDSFIQSLAEKKNLLICCDSPAIKMAENMRLKMIEGTMINTHITDYINFAHGAYQFIESSKNYCVWFVTKKENKLHSKTAQMLGSPQNKMHVSYYEGNFLPLQLQLETNSCLLQLIQILKINQMDWPGKSRQHILYDVYK